MKLKLLSALELVVQLVIVGSVYGLFFKVNTTLAAITLVSHIIYEATGYFIREEMVYQLAKTKSDYYEQLNSQIGGGNC